MAKILGIDLGTTNSCMAVMEAADLMTMARLRVNFGRFKMWGAGAIRESPLLKEGV